MASRSILAALPASMSATTATTNRVGRPAKPGDRYPSGKLKPSGTSPVQVRRMLDLIRAQSSNPILASALGWLRCHEVILDIDVAAGVSYATLRGQYDRVMDTPSRTAKSPSYQVGLGHAPGAETEEQAKHAAGVRRRYAAALNCLDNGKQRELLDKVCVYDEHPSLWEMTEFKAALDHLARHFKLTGSR